MWVQGEQRFQWCSSLVAGLQGGPGHGSSVDRLYLQAPPPSVIPSHSPGYMSYSLRWASPLWPHQECEGRGAGVIITCFRAGRGLERSSSSISSCYKQRK